MHTIDFHFHEQFLSISYIYAVWNKILCSIALLHERGKKCWAAAAEVDEQELYFH
jgi:hypothetical protein